MINMGYFPPINTYYLGICRHRYVKGLKVMTIFKPMTWLSPPTFVNRMFNLEKPNPNYCIIDAVFPHKPATKDFIFWHRSVLNRASRHKNA